MRTLRAVKGTRDLLPDEIPAWCQIESIARSHLRNYGYREIRTPIFEATELFARGIGADTDIVSKEMYTFADNDGSSLTLRPEATAGIVRSVIEHNLTAHDPALRVFTIGPMFRRERPQKGRYRQFHQLDVEALGNSTPAIDVEVIEIAVGFLEACGLTDHELVLNSVGDSCCRPAYVAALRQALGSVASRLCGDCQRRSGTNPLRVLDCKVPQDQETIDGLPRIHDHLCPECRDHFAETRRQLDLLGIGYRVSHRLVRGLDYYTRTTFEILSGDLGAQNSVLGGGRYDGLSRELGGPDIDAIGFALGIERLALIVPGLQVDRRCDVFLAPLAKGALDKALLLQRELRRQGLIVLMDYEGRSFKARMKMADKLGARLVGILGEDELAAKVWAVRDMERSTQATAPEDRVVAHILETLGGRQS